MRPLLEPLNIGALSLRNRLIMAPLTRSRASGTDGRTPNQLMKDYYVQRASAGMIISEATAVTPMGVGYANTPGIWSEDHIEGWKNITDAVHAQGGKILLQLWHVGRISHPLFLNGKLPVSASSMAPEGFINLVRPKTRFVKPRALETREISGVVAEFKKGAENALRAGFDGVEIHGANGYLLDQFLQSKSNQRVDHYGGSLENRARLMLEVTDAVTSVWGADRVGMHLAPRGDSQSMGDHYPAVTFSYVAEQLGQRKIAFLCVREHQGPDSLGPLLKKAFRGIYIGNEMFNFQSAEAALKAGMVDAVAFGRDYIANPDLVERYRKGAPLNSPVPETFYARGSTGYTDYPFLKNER